MEQHGENSLLRSGKNIGQAPYTARGLKRRQATERLACFLVATKAKHAMSAGMPMKVNEACDLHGMACVSARDGALPLGRSVLTPHTTHVWQECCQQQSLECNSHAGAYLTLAAELFQHRFGSIYFDCCKSNQLCWDPAICHCQTSDTTLHRGPGHPVCIARCSLHL
jgi:hypothetical protein